MHRHMLASIRVRVNTYMNSQVGDYQPGDVCFQSHHKVPKLESSICDEQV